MVQWLESWLPAEYLSLPDTAGSVVLVTLFVASVSALYVVDMLVRAFSKLWSRK